MKTLAPEAEAHSQTGEGCANPDWRICKIQEWGSQRERGRSYAKLLGGSQTRKETRKLQQGGMHAQDFAERSDVNVDALQVGMEPWYGRAGRERGAMPGKGGGDLPSSQAQAQAQEGERAEGPKHHARGTGPVNAVPHLPCPAP